MTTSKPIMSTAYLVRLAALTAITILLTATMIPVSTLSLTLAPVAVAVGAIVLGPSAGAFLGLVFGVTSLILAYMGRDLGPILLAAPNGTVKTWVACIIPRVLEGWITGLVFKLMSKGARSRQYSFEVSALLTALLNTIFFMGSLFILFWDSYITPFIDSVNEANLKAALAASEAPPTPIEGLGAIIIFVAGVILIQALVESLVCCVVGGAISKALTIKQRQ